jgi:hypothetical protein
MRPPTFRICRALLLSLGLMAGCSKVAETSRTGTTIQGVPQIATVGRGGVSLSELETDLKKRPGAEPQAVLDDLVMKEIFYQHARASGYETNQSFQAAYKNFLVSHYRAALAESVEKGQAISEQELEAKYAAQASNYTTGEKIRTAMIFRPVDSNATDETSKSVEVALSELRKLAINQAKEPAGFAFLATKHSLDAGSRYRGGDIGWLTREQALKRFGQSTANSLFEMSEQAPISFCLRTEDGWAIFKFLDRKKAVTRSFAELRPMLLAQAERDHMEKGRADFLARLKNSVPVKVNAALLSERFPGPALAQQAPPSTPGK